MRIFCVVLSIFFLAATNHAQWLKQTVNSTASFRGLSVVNEKIIWASGTDGTVIRTIDGGKTWNVMTVSGAEKLDFRDIEAFDANNAYILSIGNGELSRIYKTTDGGKTWKEQFRNTNEKAFFDALACGESDYCIALSDPVEGKFILITTYDGGQNWKPMYMALTPAAVPNEASFAASGTCLIFSPAALGTKLFVTGGSEARVFRGTRGHHGDWAWTAVPTPIIHGTSGSGIFSIAMWDETMWDYTSSTLNGVIVGGNYEKPDEVKDNLAFTSDAGRTWKLGVGLSGYRSAVTYIDKKTIIAVGTNGTDITRNGGKTWKKMGNEDLNAVAAKGKRAVWAVGPKGMVVKMK